MRAQVGLLAEKVGRLMDVISKQDAAGTGPAEDKVAVLEGLMWKLHLRYMRLKSAKPTASGTGPVFH